MTFIKIFCPDCNRKLLRIETDGDTPIRISVGGVVNIRCPKCMDWKNVLQQLEPFKPPSEEAENSE